jgi:hypothetical protein
MATPKTTQKRNKLLRHSKWLAILFYVVSIILGALTYNQPIFWLWFIIILACIGWFTTILLWTKRGRI